MARPINKTDAAAGGLFIAVGVLFAVQSMGMEIGTALRMGPGYFPLVLSGVMILLGAAIVFTAFSSEDEPVGTLAWRGMMFILPAPIFFGLTVRGLGFVPSIFFTTLIAARAALKMSWLASLILSVAVMIFCTLVFSVGLGLPFRRFGPWLPV
ncbi:Tripartite tricarboxylate transporter TctB family protein [Loktanella fryxellensis]|uniref:Tripartite tricarboxylate transporter TctB family protein n=1 Tax=Loktanella fryxellensis TaxID=245187 RepID=A0A1H8F0H7_9RHOB|nr:tripartite tricarboxylate transporter TctB family protein [Loktanella fryxellensis]SEN25262.1 Tripartite tricarboxylate transporter TctB family protein [Loktanella fryxellensis]